MNISKQQIDSIVTSLFDGRVAIFCGAGISIPSGIPSAAELAKIVKSNHVTRYGTTLPEALDEDLESIARYFYERNSLLTILIQRLVPWHEWHQKQPDASHLAIADLLLCGASRPIVSTNYDVLLEKASNFLGKEVDVALSGDILSLDPEQILKIHGCQRRKEQTIWCKDQLVEEDVRKRITSIQRYLTSNLSGKDLIFAGFWTDWAYLNEILVECINQLHPGRVIIIDPESEEELRRKAPKLSEWADRHPGEVEYIRDPAAEAFNAIREAYSKRFVSAAFQLAISNLEGIGANSEELESWIESLDLAGAVGAREDIAVQGGIGVVTQPRPEAWMGAVAKIISVLISDGAEYRAGKFILPSGKAIKVLNAVGLSLGRVASDCAGNLSPTGGPDYVVCAGSERSPLPSHLIHRGKKNGFFRSTVNGRFVTDVEYLAGNLL